MEIWNRHGHFHIKSEGNIVYVAKDLAHYAHDAERMVKSAIKPLNLSCTNEVKMLDTFAEGVGYEIPIDYRDNIQEFCSLIAATISEYRPK